jgi:hypothetical protein
MGSPINPAVSADSGASPTPAGPVSADIASSPGAGSAGASPTPSPENQNIRQLREQYETVRKERDAYSSFGKPEDIQSHVSIATKITTAAIEAGTALGYDEAQIRESLAENPEGTINFLRNKQAEVERNNGANTDIKKLLKEELSRELKPFYQEREQQQLDKAHSLFDTTFDAQISELFKDEKLTEDELGYLYDSTFYLLERSPEIIKQIKSGQASGIIKLVQTAKAAFDKAYLARTTRENQRIGGQKQTTGQAAQSSKKFTLDDIAQGNFPDAMKFAQ